MKLSFTLLIAAICSLARADIGWTGCQDCAGFDHNDVFNSCQQGCLQGEGIPDQAVRNYCVTKCHEYVLDRGCCPTSTCYTKGMKRRSYPPMTPAIINEVEEIEEKADDIVTREGSPVSEIISEVSEAVDESGELVARDGFSACCVSCRALATMSNFCPNSRLSMGLNMASMGCKAGCQVFYKSAYPCGI